MNDPLFCCSDVARLPRHWHRSARDGDRHCVSSLSGQPFQAEPRAATKPNLKAPIEIGRLNMSWMRELSSKHMLGAKTFT